jgi:hypothetical protein
VSLLTASLVTVVGAGAWWWVTWPERTARSFVQLLHDGRWQEVGMMLRFPRPPEPLRDDESEAFYRNLRVKPAGSRQISQLILGIHAFEVFSDYRERRIAQFVVIRGVVYPMEK